MPGSGSKVPRACWSVQDAPYDWRATDSLLVGQHDDRLRHFIFGAAATLILPPVRTFHILDGRHAIPRVHHRASQKLFDLPMQQMFDLIQKLDDQQTEMSAIRAG